MHRSLFLAQLAICLAILANPALGQMPELTPSTLDIYQQAIEPTDDEIAFLNIDWHSTLSQAVSIAHESEKPLLVYVMNGHPLGCT